MSSPVLEKLCSAADDAWKEGSCLHGQPYTELALPMYRHMCAKRAVCMLQTELRREALHLAEEFRERNRTALLNLLSDSTIALTGFILLLRNSDGRGALFGTIGRVFSGFSDTAKAFLIIACKRLGLYPSHSHHSSQ